MIEDKKENNIINEFEEILEKTENVANVSEEKDLKNLNNDAGEKKEKRGGAREGAGMKKGQKTRKTMEDKIAMDYIRKRVIGALPTIMNSQMNLARGCQYLFKLKKVYDSKTGKYVVPKGGQPKIVKDKKEIAEYLAGEFDGKEDCDYYFLTTEKPDNKALDSLLDRTLGKATQKVEARVGLTLSDLIDTMNGEKIEDEEEISFEETNEIEDEV